MTTQEKKIIDGLISRDKKITDGFFYAQCKPLLSSVARDTFMEDMDYDAILDSFYMYLVADEGAVLKEFGSKEVKSTLYKWLRDKARKYFAQLKKQKGKEQQNKQPQIKSALPVGTAATSKKEKEMDIAAMIDMVELERDRLVLEKIDIDGVSYDNLAEETGLSKANLYNIRKRAIERLKQKARIALGDTDTLCAIRCEQYVLDMFGIHKPLFELKRLAEEKGWLSDSGVAIENLGRIPKYYGLSVRKFRGDLNKVASAIESGKQVLVAVDGGELIGNPFEEKLEDMIVGGIADHCVVVLSYDKDDSKVTLFNPAFGDIPLTVSTATFLDAWADSGNYAVEVMKI